MALRPGSRPLVDFIVEDHGDGPVLREGSMVNPPTQEEVDALTTEQLDAAQASKRGSVPISDRQFAHALWVSRVITHVEAMAFVQTGTIPAALKATIDAIEVQSEREAAELLVAGATEFHRNHPMTLALGAAMGWTPEQVDALWATAATL